MMIARRWRFSRFGLFYVSFAALALVSCALTRIAIAVESASAVLPAPSPTDQVIKSSWDGDSAAVYQPAATEAEATLAERVAALEKYIHDQETATTAAAEEPLPAGAVAEATPECTPLDVIVKPTFTPTGRIYFDGVTYDDDDETDGILQHGPRQRARLPHVPDRRQGQHLGKPDLQRRIRASRHRTSITYKDIYMEQQNLPGIGHFRAGHFKEPIGLEEFGSDLFLTFMEKSPATQAFTPSRNFGVMIWDNVRPLPGCDVVRGSVPRRFAGFADQHRALAERQRRLVVRRAAGERCRTTTSRRTDGTWCTWAAATASGTSAALTTGATDNQNVAYSTLNGLAEFTQAVVGRQPGADRLRRRGRQRSNGTSSTRNSW